MGWKAMAIAFVASFVTVSTANAGFLDFLFGRRAPAAAQPVAQHPDVTVTKPRVKRVAKADGPRKPKQMRLVALTPKDQRARTIDPIANPDWYLTDPTLRRGDILVLADRVLVFKGGEIGAPKSYVSLNETRLYNRKERLLIAEMTKQPNEPFLLADKAGPRQPRLLKSASLLRPLELRSGL